MKNIFIITISLFSFYFCSSQNHKHLGFLNKEVNIHRQEIVDSFKKSKCFNSSQKFILINVFGMTYDSMIIKEDFIDKSFLKKMSYIYENRNKKCDKKSLKICTGLLISNEDTSICIAYKNYIQNDIFCAMSYNPKTYYNLDKLLNIIKKHNIEIIFSLNDPLEKLYFAIDRNEDVFVLKKTGIENGFIVYTLNQFITDFWQEFHHDMERYRPPLGSSMYKTD